MVQLAIAARAGNGNGLAQKVHPKHGVCVNGKSEDCGVRNMAVVVGKYGEGA